MQLGLLCCRTSGLEPGHVEHLALLKEAVDDADEAVRREAARAVAYALELSDATFPTLIRMLSHEDSEIAAYAWEELDKHLNDGSLEYASSCWWAIRMSRRRRVSLVASWQASMSCRRVSGGSWAKSPGHCSRPRRP